ncbi:hypothetical protein ACQEU3_10340 [Spirillospora sp. CA-253888]
MRRTAAVTLATGLFLTALSATAEAAPRTWSTTGYKAVKASGTYTRTSTKVTVSGHLKDYKKNGWAAAVQFRATERGRTHTSKVYFFLYKGVPADLPYSKEYGKFFSSDYTERLYARECGVKPNRARTTKCAGWKRVY